MNNLNVISQLHKSTYHLVIVGIYLCFCVYFFFSTETYSLYYTFPNNNLLLIVIISIFAFLNLFFIQKLLHFGTLGVNRLNLSQFVFIIVYATILIGIPEEIIFRGYVHSLLSPLLSNSSIVVLLSSLVFGLAHILNEARSLYPRDWNWKLVTLSFIAGLYLGTLYELTQSLLVPTILHAFMVLALKVFIKRKSLLEIN